MNNKITGCIEEQDTHIISKYFPTDYLLITKGEMYLYHAEICQIPPSSNDQIYPHQNYCHRHQVTHWEHSTYVLFLQNMFKLNLLMKKIKTIRQIQIEDTL